jgi:CBS-domain-containing membrane protein
MGIENFGHVETKPNLKMMKVTAITMRKNWKQYLFQSLWGAVMIMLLIFLTDFILSETIFASFGATIFIASTMPLSKTSEPRYLIGGYSCGIVSGIFGFLMCAWLPIVPVAVFAGIAVCLAIFLMVWLCFEHPPACALALGLVLSQKPLFTALISFCGIVTVCVVLYFTKRWMKNLL